MGKEQKSLYVVGIGSSAGGLDALKSFFSGVKEPTNIAFVIIQHQNPEYKTLLPKLISKVTDIPIKIIDDSESIEPKIYVAPPGKNVEIKGDKLILTPPNPGYSPSPSVDYFFESLGNEYRDRAYGVVLSGTGGDGSIGIRTIKSEDGIVFAQDVEEAAYDGMPGSAIETGIVDFVMPAASMAFEIERLCSTERDGILSSIKDENEKNLNPIFSLLAQKTGVDFYYYKPATVARRIERRMVATKNYDIKSYKEYIQDNQQEVKLLFKDLLIGVTSFFRDSEAFSDLTKTIKEYIKNKDKNSLRVWSAGCSTGEEAYTIAIILHELLGEQIGSFSINIFATDLDEDSIMKARKGIYPQSAMLKIDRNLINKYFIYKNGNFEATKKIRDMIIFSLHNVIKDPPFVKLDLISCRNMMIYMDQSTQKRLFEIFHYSLNPDGMLFLGKSESATNETKYFKPTSQRSKIFKRVAGVSKTPTSIYGKRKRAPQIEITAPSQKNSLEDEISQAILGTLINKNFYSCAVLNENLELLYTYGDLSKYLKLPQGRMNSNIHKLINQALSVELRAAITKTLKDDTLATKNTIIKDGDKKIKVTIHATSVKSSTSGDFVVILFRDDKVGELNKSAQTSESYEPRGAREKELEEELLATREYLQTVVEELETSNEELQALNEELQASNEELQATNEEMETSNEELSSTNEELQSAYSELRSLYTEREEKRKVLELYVDELKTSQKMLESKNKELIEFQKELGSKENLLHSIFETSNIGICITDEEGRFVKVNKAYIELYGYSPSELIGYHFTKVIPPEAREMAKKMHDDFISGESEIPTEWDVVDKNGNELKILATAARLNFHDDIVHKITTIMDITEYSKVQNQVKESESKFRTIFDTALGMIFIYNINEELRPEGIIDANSATLDFLGCSKKKILSLSIRDIIKDFDEKAIVTFHKELIDNKNKAFKKYLENSNGDFVYAEIEASIVKVDGKNSVFMIARDISDKIENEKKFNLVNLVFDNMNEGIVVTDENQKIMMTNSKIEELMGYTKDELLGQTPKIFKSNWHGKKFYKEMWSGLKSNGFWEGEIWDRRQNGEFVAEWLRIDSAKDENGKITNYIALSQEITDRKKQEEKIKHLAYYDPLTDLPNRLLFNDRLDLAIKRAKRTAKKVAIVFIDIDRFKAINDTYGHKIGDEVLIETASRIKKSLRSQDTTASRLSGDEFTILIEDINEGFVITSLLNKLTEKMKEPITVENHQIATSISMGVSIYPDDGEYSEELLKNADSAMYNAKSRADEDFCFYTKKMSEGLKRKLEIDRYLRAAVKNNELYLNFQPQIELKSLKVIGIETLLRWNSPQLGAVSPSEFIEVAEENGLIHEIGIFVLKEAISFYKNSISKLKGDIKISINISPKQLDADNFLDIFDQIVSSSKIDIKNLDIEITENIFANRSSRIVKNLNALKQKGVLISIDDFGTGYSSLSYITRFEPYKIKIDRSFVIDMEENSNVRTLISAIIDLSHSLNCMVIAEGAESVNEVDRLKSMGCDEIQGYYFSKPLSADEVQDYIKTVNK